GRSSHRRFSSSWIRLSAAEIPHGKQLDYGASAASGGPQLTWPWASKIRLSSSAVGRGVSGGGRVGALAGIDRSRNMRSRPDGVLRTSTRAVSLSTRKV